MSLPAELIVAAQQETLSRLDLVRLLAERLNRFRGWSGIGQTNENGAVVFDFPGARFDAPPVVTATCQISGQSVLVPMVGAVTEARATVRVAVVTAGAIAPAPAGITVHAYARLEG